MKIHLKKLSRSLHPPKTDLDIDVQEFKSAISSKEFRNKLKASAIAHTRSKLVMYKEKIDDSRDINIELSGRKGKERMHQIEVYSQKERNNKNEQDDDGSWDDDDSWDSEDEYSDTVDELSKKNREIIKALNHNLELLTGNTSDTIIKARLTNILEHPDHGLHTLEGRNDVYQFATGMIYAFARNYKVFSNAFMNCVIVGNPGTGKTAAALVLANVFHKVFFLATDKVSINTASNLVAEYTGQTGPKTKTALINSLEGVFFLDEAYSLAGGIGKDGSTDYGSDSITEIVNFLDKTRGLSVMIVAGYEKEMDKMFFKANPGLERRFPIKFSFTDYDHKVLMRILMTFIAKAELEVDAESQTLLAEIIRSASSHKILVNQAGDMLNFTNLIMQNAYTNLNLDWRNHIERREIILKAATLFFNSKGFSYTMT
jgi:SpoVK/Ycf46/Vps4 family AAA+-type ATPase